MVVGATLAAYSWAPSADRLPSVSVRTGARGDGFTLKVGPPRGSSRRRLRESATQLVADMHAYLKDLPRTPGSEAVASHFQTDAELRAAATDEERHSVWARHSAQLIEQYERDRQELGVLFAGRLGYVLDRFVELGVLEPSRRSLIEWHAQSRHWLTAGAAEVEALTHRL